MRTKPRAAQTVQRSYGSYMFLWLQLQTEHDLTIELKKNMVPMVPMVPLLTPSTIQNDSCLAEEPPEDLPPSRRPARSSASAG